MILKTAREKCLSFTVANPEITALTRLKQEGPRVCEACLGSRVFWFPRTKLQAKDSRGVGHGVNLPVNMSPSEYQHGSQQMLQRSGDGERMFFNPWKKIPANLDYYI